MMGPTSSGRGSRLVATLVVAVALLTGVLVGIAVDRRLLAPWRGPQWMGGGRFGSHWGWGAGGLGGRGGPGGPERVRQRFASELGLTPAQVTQVDSIMARGMSVRRALEDSMRPRMRAQIDSTRAQIERVLTPDQRTKFEAWRSREHADRGAGP
jgi:Spy/CpxP family protein refolding chaperone